jgi:hypothetical protein
MSFSGCVQNPALAEKPRALMYTRHIYSQPLHASRLANLVPLTAARVCIMPGPPRRLTSFAGQQTPAIHWQHRNMHAASHHGLCPLLPARHARPPAPPPASTTIAILAMERHHPLRKPCDASSHDARPPSVRHPQCPGGPLAGPFLNTRPRASSFFFFFFHVFFFFSAVACSSPTSRSARGSG